jgi:hypothetical protein
MPSTAGLAHVAACSFLAARAAPSFAFWLALTGGAALARVGEQEGVRAGYGASVAATLQTVAMVGPVRFNAPLTQALTAPLLGAMHARGRNARALVAACLAIRLAHYTVLSAFALLVLVGPRGYAGGYDAIFGWISWLPHGLGGAIALTVASNVAFALFFSVVQVVVYRRALAAWPAAAPPAAVDLPASPAAPSQPTFLDPRAVLAAAALVSVALIASPSAPVLLAATAWLALTSVFSRLDRSVLPLGAALAAALAVGTALAAAVGGLAYGEVLRRAARAGLLVLVATWMRAAAGSAGLRAAFGRGLRRASFAPAAREAAEVFAELDSDQRLAPSAQALAARLREVPRRVQPVAAAVLAWAAAEAAAFQGSPAAPGRLRWRARDLALALSALVPVASLLVA